MKPHLSLLDHLPVLQHPEDWRLVPPDSPPDAGIPNLYSSWYRQNRHAHSHGEIMVALAGESWYGVGDGHIRVVPGTVLLLDAMALHQRMYPPFERNVVHLWIHLLHDRFSAGIVTVEDGHCRGTPTVLVKSPGLPSQPTPAGGLSLQVRRLATVSSAVAALLEELERPSGQPGLDDQQARLMATIQAHLQRTAGCGDSVESLARIAGYSRYHFLRLFKKYTGTTVQQYIDHCRKRRVAELLDRQLSRKEIGYELGFSSPQAFSRWCRQHEVS